MDQGWVRYIKFSKDVSGLDWIYQNKEGWINLGRIYQVEKEWIIVEVYISCKGRIDYSGVR